MSYPYLVYLLCSCTVFISTIWVLCIVIFLHRSISVINDVSLLLVAYNGTHISLYQNFFILRIFGFFLLFSSQLPNWLKIALSYRWSVNSILTETICLYLIFKTNLKISSYALKGPLNIFCPIYPLNKLEHGHPNFNVYRDRRRCSWMSPYITILFFP